MPTDKEVREGVRMFQEWLDRPETKEALGAVLNDEPSEAVKQGAACAGCGAKFGPYDLDEDVMFGALLPKCEDCREDGDSND